MKKGDVVKVYEQPLSETKFEGEAKLISFIKRGDIIELWRVKFICDGQVVTRAIKIKEKNALEKLLGFTPTLQQVASYYKSWLAKLKYYQRMGFDQDIQRQVKKIDDLLQASKEVYGK